MRRTSALACALALALLAAPAAEARSSQFTIFEANRELRSHDTAERAAALDEIRAFGVRWIRVVMYWREVAPEPGRTSAPRLDETDPAAYDWTSYERLVDDARARGIRGRSSSEVSGRRRSTLEMVARLRGPSLARADLLGGRGRWRPCPAGPAPGPRRDRAARPPRPTSLR